jgi:hypothetical protein
VLGALDQRQHGRLVALAQQRDRVRLAADDRVEERLALLEGGQRRLRPAARVVQQHREARVVLAELLGDFAFHPLGQGGRRSGRRDRDRERAAAHDRGQDEVAQRRHVDDVDEHRAGLGVLVHRDVDLAVVGRGDHQERPREIRGHVLAALPDDRALGGQPRQLLVGMRRDERDVAATEEQPLDLLEADLAAADDQAAPPRQTQAGDVERHRKHVAHARLVADAATVLADALFAGVGLGGHLHSLDGRPGRPNGSAAPSVHRVRRSAVRCSSVSGATRHATPAGRRR